MKPVKIIVIALLSYVALVVVFETAIGIFQPSNEGTLVITTSDADGEQKDRVLARLASDGKLYIAANHWPRAWYNQALAQPNVDITLADVGKGAYTAIPVTDAEHDRVDSDNPLPLPFRFVTGFPPRYFLRLDPR